MGRIPKLDDAPTYRRTTIRRRGADDEAAAPEAAPPPSPAAPPPAPAAPPPVAAAPPPAPAAPPPVAAAPPVRPPPRPNLDGDALLAELASFDQADLAALMAQGSPADFEPGDEVTGTVVRLTHDTVFVDVGAKSEAWLALAELEGRAVQVGERLTARVLSAGGAGVRLTRHLGAGAGLDALESAMEAGIPVDGRVESRNTGGFVVAMGGLRAFCPVSHIDRHPGTDLDAYVGRTLPFRVLEVRGRDVVVSHRSVADEEAQKHAATLWSTLKVGDELSGVVTGERPFGVFVDVGGVTGLVHKSELGWGDETVAPAVGTRVQVRVVELDATAGRISLSMRDAALGPWSRVGTEILEGQVYPGKVVRLADFGAFIELLPGLQGLAHISTLADRRLDHPGEVLKVGELVSVRVLSVDRERQRIELGLRQATEGWEPEAPRQPRGGPAHAEGGSLGTLADLLGGLKLKR